jgi:secondary thiamine-phosphate synthase enzyme
MSTRAAVAEPIFTTFTDAVTLRTQARRQFIDVTELVAERVRRSGIREGLVSVQSHHTTTAVVVNEDEPLLLGDFDRLLDRLCPADVAYGHDDLARRSEVTAEERPNGASHCRSLLLGSGQTLHVSGGVLRLGRWQRLLLVELDGPRSRTVSIVVLGGGARS